MSKHLHLGKQIEDSSKEWSKKPLFEYKQVKSLAL